MKKKPVLLLEVLIALTLIAICASLLVRQPLLLHRAEVEQLRRVECDQIAAWTYTEIKEKFLRNEIPWSEIPPLKEKSKSFPLSKASFSAAALASAAAQRSFTIETLREKQEPDGKINRLISIHIEIGSDKKKYRFSYQMNIYKSPAKHLAPVAD